MHPHAPTMESVANSNEDRLDHALRNAGWFMGNGAYVLVDGQYGSTGKGLMASVIGSVGKLWITHVTTNAGPNSGHTAYINGKKVMTQQLPIAGLVVPSAKIYLNAGAVIDAEILQREIKDIPGMIDRPVSIHPTAAMIREVDRDGEKNSSAMERIASTGKGVGAALAAKIGRVNNVAGHLSPANGGLKSYLTVLEAIQWDWDKDCVFVETAQGFSLGLNEARFHPFTTSRECTVMQAIADARIPPKRVRNVCACYRTFPIRVGNANGYSGDCYPDQVEMTWEQVGQPPELTSVTKRVRRVFSWSRQQFMESVAANEPDTLFLNFMNYLRDDTERAAFIKLVERDYEEVRRRPPRVILLGFGPRPEDVRVYESRE